MRVELGYPAPEVEALLLAGEDRQGMMNSVASQMTSDQLAQLQADVEAVTVSEHLRSYILSLLSESRQSGEFGHGLSPRAGIALQRAAQSWALIEGRNYAIPEDVQAVFKSVAEHRLFASVEQTDNIADNLLNRVPIPD
jgi:MoxR-like ATPase